MRVKALVTLLTGVLECLLFSGILFGWASIRYVLQQEGYFSDLCESSSFTNVSSPAITSTGTAEYGTQLHNNYTTQLNTTISNVTVRSASSLDTINSTTAGTLSSVKYEVEEYPSCDAQSEQLNLVFTIASTLLSFSTLINGYIFDRFGTWVSRVIAVVFLTIGCVLMMVSSVQMSWFLFPSMTCFAVGGILVLVTNLQIGNLFSEFRSSVITMMSGALDSSSFVFLIFKMLHDADISLIAIFHAAAWCTIFLWIRTFFLLPRHSFPFPLPKDYEYGLSDCNCGKKKMEQRELVLLNPSDAENKEEIETLAVSCEHETKMRQGPSVLELLKSSLLWGNIMHFSLLQLRNYFFMGSLVEWLLALTNSSSDELDKYLVAFGICQLFGVFLAPLNGLLIDVVSRILLKRTAMPALIPLKASIFSAIATTLLGTLFSIIIVIPSLTLQYFSFILQVIFRSFLYGGNVTFIAIAFPGQHFGKLYGFTMFLGGCVNLLQFPLFTIVLRQMDGSFFIMNVIFVFVSLVTLLHPLNIWRHCCKKSALKGKSFMTEED